jgi:hypothetical protein
VFSGNQGSGVFKSTDYGLHWSQANDGLGNLYVNTLSIDAGGVIYAGTQGGVYTSVDSGKTWVAANSGLTNLNIYALAFSPSSKVYAGAYTTGHTGGLWVANMPLPITLVSFTARGNPHGAGVLLEWVTASETNNYGFYVQSRVNSRQTFEDLPNSFVPGHGTSIEQHHYSFIHTTGVAGKCEYRLKQVDLDGTVHYPQVATLKSGQSALAGEKPVEFSLSQNYPNPFNPSTVIRYGLPVEVHLSLAVYNALGQLVCRLADEEQVAGYHEVKFDGTDLGSGVYLYRLTAGGFTQTRKMLLVR